VAGGDASPSQLSGGNSTVRYTVAFAICLAAFVSFGSDTAGARGPVRSLKEIREQGVVMQQWDNSCGAAALATVLTYVLGHPISEQDVATGMLRKTEPLKVRYRGGFSLLDMKRFVAALGFEGAGYRGLTLEDLKQFENAILPISVHGYAHFIVFRGFDAHGNVLFADPAFGNRKVSISRFANIWKTGIGFVVTRRTT